MTIEYWVVSTNLLTHTPKYMSTFSGTVHLTGGEQEKKSLKRKIRKDFYKVKQELELTNYMFDDLRFSNFVKE